MLINIIIPYLLLFKYNKPTVFKTNKELGNDNSKTPTLFLDMDKMKEDETKKENTQLKGTISQLQEKIKALTKEVCQLYKLRILV